MLLVSTQTAMPGLTAPSHCLPACSFGDKQEASSNNESQKKKSKHWTDVQYLKGLYTDFPCKQSDSTTIDYKNWVCFKELIMAMKISLT